MANGVVAPIRISMGRRVAARVAQSSAARRSQAFTHWDEHPLHIWIPNPSIWEVENGGSTDGGDDDHDFVTAVQMSLSIDAAERDIVSVVQASLDNHDRMVADAIAESLAEEEASKLKVVSNPETRACVVEATLGSRVRTLHVKWSLVASTEKVFGTLDEEVQRAFGLNILPRMTYLDEDGDECTLVVATIRDFLAHPVGGLRLRVTASDWRDKIACAEISIATPRHAPASPSSSIGWEIPDDFADESGWALLPCGSDIALSL